MCVREDAITWSVFGTVSRADPEKREVWVKDLLSLLDLTHVSAVRAEIYLWRRIPHPDTLVPGGPEIDFGILTENAVIFGEAKWQSGVGKVQGKRKDKDQIQLRVEFLSKYAGRIFPHLPIRVVVGVSLFPDTFSADISQDVTFRSTTWEKVCGLECHPLHEEVGRYFRWKRTHSK